VQGTVNHPNSRDAGQFNDLLFRQGGQEIQAGSIKLVNRPL